MKNIMRCCRGSTANPTEVQSGARDGRPQTGHWQYPASNWYGGASNGDVHDAGYLSGKTQGNGFVWHVQVENLLRNWIKKDPIFLAIDNILPDSNSLDEARFYLDCEFAKGSKIFITSRSGKILEQVISDYTRFSTVIEYIPRLKLEEARDIFVHGIPELAQISNVEDEVKECVSACVIRMRKSLYHQHFVNDKWYHPLMLKSSTASIRHDRRRNVVLKSRLREFMKSAAAVDKSDAWKTVFNMLDITYATLSAEEKKVFLDLALFYKGIDPQSSYAWIQRVHSHLDKKKLDKILFLLEDLSFIIMEMEDMHYQRVQMHDLMVDFALEVIKRMLEPGAGSAPHYLVLDSGAQLRNPAFSFLLADAVTTNGWPSISASPKSVRTVSISMREYPGALPELDLRNREIEVLHLVDNPGLQEVVLSHTTLAHLRSFIVKGPYERGTSLRCTIDEDRRPTPPTASQMMTGGKLVWLQLEGNVIFSATGRKQRWWPWAGGKQRWWWARSTAACDLGILQAFFCDLQYLALTHFPAKSIDVTTCTSLEELRIDNCNAKIIDVTSCTNLELLSIHNCTELLRLSIPGHRRLFTKVSYCESLKRISLLITMSTHRPETDRRTRRILQNLDVGFCPALRNIDGIGQYTGSCVLEGMQLLAILQELLESVETGSSKFKATVKDIHLSGYPVQGLAGLDHSLDVRKAQHVGLLISALVKAQATRLGSLKIHCKEDGDCGCDKNEPHFGPMTLSDVWDFKYHCPQVRNLASLPQPGHRLSDLSLRGCRNVEVWPDFALMTSLRSLDLSYTSLKEWPTVFQQLPRLSSLDIQGCQQLPAEEMMKPITCKPLGCNSVLCRGSLASLWADLRGRIRDRGSVADALDSHLPELVALVHEQWRYLRYTCPILYSSRPISKHGDELPAAELCYLIRLMYDLWFGEAKAGSTNAACADSVPKIKEKMKRLLCTGIVMSLPFYVWRIGNNRQHSHSHALDEWEEYPWPEGYESYMAFALIGSASIGCFNASLNDDLKERMINFVQSFAEAKPLDELLGVQPVLKTQDQLGKRAHAKLAMRVGDAVCKMARAPSMAAALDQDLTHITMDGLKASYDIVQLPREAYGSLGRWVRWLRPLPMSRRIVGGFRRWEMKGRRPSVAAKSGDASMHTTMDAIDGLGARILLTIMPKILPHSVLDFYGQL